MKAHGVFWLVKWNRSNRTQNSSRAYQHKMLLFHLMMYFDFLNWDSQVWSTYLPGLRLVSGGSEVGFGGHQCTGHVHENFYQSCAHDQLIWQDKPIQEAPKHFEHICVFPSICILICQVCRRHNWCWGEDPSCLHCLSGRCQFGTMIAC